MIKNYIIGFLLIIPSALFFVGGMFLSNVWFDVAPFWYFSIVALLSVGLFLGGLYLVKYLANKKP